MKENYYELDGEKYLKWTGNNQKEIIKFLGTRIRKITFRPHLIFNGFHIKKGTWLCKNKYGGLDFLTEEGRIHKIVLLKYYLSKEKIIEIIDLELSQSDNAEQALICERIKHKLGLDKEK